MASSDVPGPGQFTFVRKEDRGGNDGGNMAAAFARKALRDEYSKADGQLLSDFESVLRGEAIYLPNFHCAKRDYALLAGLAKDMEEHESASEGGGMINWSKHLKHENPEFSETFKRVTDAMAAHFDVEIYATRLNFYRDGTDWKPFHHDSHAYGGREKREDFTMGASFGSERELTFLHEPSGQQFSFPQQNGDVFAFTTEVNKRFKHGVPKLTRGAGGPRFSIIAWGRRRTLNANNGGAKGGELRSAEDNLDHAATRDAATVSAVPATTREGASNDPVMGSGEVSELIRAFLRDEEARDSRERARARSGPGGRVGRSRGGAGEAAANGADADADFRNASAAARRTPPGVVVPETRGSAPVAAKLRAALGDSAYAALRAAGRSFQRGEMDALEFYDAATAACGESGGETAAALAAHLPDPNRREELFAARAERARA